MLAEDCERYWLHFAEIERAANSPAAIEAEAQHRRRRNEHPLVQGANRYMKRVTRWFKSHEEAFKEKGEDLAGKLQMGLPGHNAEAEARELVDAVDIIRWYHMFIGAKIARAIGHDGDDDAQEARDDVQSDGNG